MTPLEIQIELQKRVKRTRKENPDVADITIAKRFGIGLMKFRQLLTDEIPYPSSYKISAKRIGLSVEYVAAFKERGEHWCHHCKKPFPRDQFKDGGSGISRHTSSLCVKGKRKKKQ